MSYLLKNNNMQDYSTKDFVIKSLEEKEITENEYRKLISFENFRKLIKLGYIKIQNIHNTTSKKEKKK